MKSKNIIKLAKDIKQLSNKELNLLIEAIENTRIKKLYSFSTDNWSWNIKDDPLDIGDLGLLHGAFLLYDEESDQLFVGGELSITPSSFAENWGEPCPYSYAEWDNMSLEEQKEFLKDFVFDIDNIRYAYGDVLYPVLYRVNMDTGDLEDIVAEGDEVSTFGSKNI